MWFYVSISLLHIYFTYYLIINIFYFKIRPHGTIAIIVYRRLDIYIYEKKKYYMPCWELWCVSLNDTMNLILQTSVEKIKGKKYDFQQK